MQKIFLKVTCLIVIITLCVTKSQDRIQSVAIINDDTDKESYINNIKKSYHRYSSSYQNNGYISNLKKKNIPIHLEHKIKKTAFQAFMDSVYGKPRRRTNKQKPKSFGRKQHWDIQFGK
jgi:hypothetical protein